MSHKRSRLMSALTAALTLLMVTAVSAPASATTYPFTWSLSADTTVSNLNTVDEPVGSFTDVVSGTSYFYRVFSDGGNQWKTYRATSIADLDSGSGSFTSTTFATTGFPQAVGNEEYWVSGGVWVDTSTSPHTWYSTVHVEYQYANNTTSGPNGNYDHFRRIMVATSTNQGTSWTLGDTIISADHGSDLTSSLDFPNQMFDFGPGDQHLFVDTASGYFYVTYSSVWFENGSFSSGQTTGRIARCPITSKMVAGCWAKWHNGGWSEPGIGGHDTEITNSGGLDNIFYSTYLGKYVKLSILQGGSVMSISTTSNMSTQVWTTQDLFAGSTKMSFYHWTVDPTTSSNWVMGGSTFRIYSASNNVQGSAKYTTVTLGSGSTTPSSYSATYPSEYVPDSDPDFRAAPGVLTIDDASIGTSVNKVNYTGSGWTHWDNNTPAYGTYVNTWSYSGTTNAQASMSFVGTQLRLYGVKGVNAGIAGVSIDGGAETMVDLYAASTAGGVLVYTSSTLSYGQHSVAVRVTGNKNASATATTIFVDRLDITEGTATTIDNATTGSGTNQFDFHGTWGHCTSCSPTYGTYGGTWSYSGTTNAYVDFDFVGTNATAYIVTGTGGGRVAVSLDGGAETILDTYSSTIAGAQPLWSTGRIDYGSHTIRLRVVGTKNSASSGYDVDPDYVVVNGS